ncbi:hypothetical protein P7C73_g6068, partial [Tremellales sp. Uapishka_1]
MKLSQYLASFAGPLRTQEIQPLIRLLSCHNKTARGLSDTVGAVEEKRLLNPGNTLPEPWDGIALRHCALILTYLLPLHLLRGSFPSAPLLSRYPRLDSLFTPFIDAIKDGNVKEYDERLEWAQPRLVGMSVYLTVERAREVCLRGLFKKAWIASDKSSRIPIETFRIALELHQVEVDAEEVECMVANMIYRGFMKGYISHEKQMVVLAKNNAFPKLNTIVRA